MRKRTGAVVSAVALSGVGRLGADEADRGSAAVERLTLNNTEATDAGLKKLQNVLPKCQIVWEPKP